MRRIRTDERPVVIESDRSDAQALVLRRSTPATAPGRMVVFLVHLYALYTLAFLLSCFPTHRQDGPFSRLAVLAVRTRYALWRLMAAGWSE